LRKALHPDPARRYRSAGEFASDLKALLERRTTTAESIPEWTSADADDLEKTRRTLSGHLDADPDATRRTGAPRDRLPPKAFRPVREKRPLTPRQRQIRLAVIGFLVVAFGWFVWNEVSVWRGGQALRTELEAERLTDMDAAWQRYVALAKRNHLPLVLWGTRRAVLSRMIGSADRVIRDYRNSESLSVTEGDWVRALATLDKALELDPGHREIRGKRFLVNGHINRINGTARGNGKLLTEARSNFEQAAELLSGSPDPWLGLARLHVYGLKDVGKAEEALETAEKRGYTIARRDKAQLADGYRDRGERLLREADRATGMPEEEDYLKRSEKDYRRAQQLYSEIVPFGGSATSLRAVLDYLAHIEVRLKIVEEDN
jgi:tetratricopeptide (TPR) repeat protein